MKIKTATLSALALDWAVAAAEGLGNLRKDPHRFDDKLIMNDPEGNVRYLESLNYTSDWAQGGPIIERERIDIAPCSITGISETGEEVFIPDGWQAFRPQGFYWQRITYMRGDTPLIAAMRCFVRSKLGDDIEVPTYLLDGSES